MDAVLLQQAREHLRRLLHLVVRRRIHNVNNTVHLDEETKSPTTCAVVATSPVGTHLGEVLVPDTTDPRASTQIEQSNMHLVADQAHRFVEPNRGHDVSVEFCAGTESSVSVERQRGGTRLDVLFWRADTSVDLPALSSPTTMKVTSSLIFGLEPLQHSHGIVRDDTPVLRWQRQCQQVSTTTRQSATTRRK